MAPKAFSSKSERCGILIVNRPFKGGKKKQKVYFISHKDLEEFEVKKKNEKAVLKTLAPVGADVSHVLTFHGELLDFQQCDGRDSRKPPCCAVSLAKVKEVIGDVD